MIFYFSGTGNSRYVAKELACATNDTVVNITKDEMDKVCEYVIKEGENLGFVFPIYWWGMPTLVEEFVQKMKLKLLGENYVYGVCTYGLEPCNGLHDLKRILQKKEIRLQATFEVKMVDNYVVGYELAEKAKQEMVCKQAAEKVEKIISDVKVKKEIKVTDVFATTIKPIVHKAYKCTDHRKKFFVTEDCTGCGYCAKNCPCQAIVMENQKPVWKENCAFCLKCIHSCPKQALQNGKGTIGRTRYLNSMEK